jgi:phosphate transport system protein
VRASFHEGLEQLEAALQEEGSLVLRALRSALNALAEHDLELANEVIGFDDEVDRAYVSIEEGVQTLLARQTPVAVDLRRVLAIFRVNLHLERMADYCVTIAKLTKLTEGLPSEQELLRALDEMGARVEDMIRVALLSFTERDVEQARLLTDLDEAVDVTNRRAVEEVIALGADPEAREWGLRMLMISRCIERIGDHAVDIGEQTAYLVTAEFREFTDASHPR